MTSWQAAVRDFHLAMGAWVEVNPADPGRLTRQLRIDLLQEECLETIDELREPALDLVALAKELADLLYVTIGTAVSCGIDLDAVFTAVHESNMAKLTGPVRADGKRLKPEGWQPPDIAAALGLPRPDAD